MSEQEPGPEGVNEKRDPSSSELLGRSLVGGVGATIGTTVVGPEATVAVALATPYVEAALTGTIRRAAEWVETFGKRAAPDGRAEELIEHLQNHPQAAALLTDAGFAAARTDYEVKLEAIGQAIADGVLFERGVKFDTEAAIVRSVCALERPHVVVLDRIEAFPKGTRLERAAPSALRVALPSLVGELERLGLVGRVPPPAPILRPGRIGSSKSEPTLDTSQQDVVRYRRTSLGSAVMGRYRAAGGPGGGETETGHP